MMTETVVTVQDASHPNNAKNDANQPPAHPVSPLAWIKINTEYFKSLPGMLKIAQLLIAIICMACASPAFYGGSHFFLFVVTTSFIATIIWIFIYLLGVREALKLPIDWMLTELVNTAIVGALYLIASIVQLSTAPMHNYHRGSNITAGIFGLLNTLAYLSGTYFLYVEWKSNAVGQ